MKIKRIKLHRPTIVISLIWIAGCFKSFILPYFKYHLFPNAWTWLEVPPWVMRSGDPAVFLFGFLTTIGFIAFLVRGQRLVERKESGPFTYLGLAILIGGLYAFFYELLGEDGPGALYKASETPFWAVSLGLAMAFYKLEDAKSLLYFFVPMGICFLLPVNISLLEHFAPGLVPKAILKVAPHYTFPKAFKDPWFWSDGFVDYFILPYFLFWAVLRRGERVPKKRYLLDRFIVGAKELLLKLFVLWGVAGAIAIAVMFAGPKIYKAWRQYFTPGGGGGIEDNGGGDNGKTNNGAKTNGGKTSNGGKTNGGGNGGTTVQPRGGCPAGMCWSNGYCCPNIAKYYCNGGCYATMSQAMSVGGSQCATYKIICD